MTRSLRPFFLPVLVINYFPVRNGRIDKNVTGDVDAPLEKMQDHVVRTTWDAMYALEHGSAFRRYKNNRATPCLRYGVVDTIEFHEPMPVWNKPGRKVPMTDYNAIMERIDAKYWVEEVGVKEFWIWGYHGGVLDLWESNMAGPHGDISNSDRDPNDLPVFDKTYTVYHYNYQRTASEAVENHMHQIEAVLREIDRNLFWNTFVGKPGEGRCGWAHFPPNGERDYDWQNPKKVMSDIEDWQPDGRGELKEMCCEQWHADSLNWFMYWMQSLPGENNGIRYKGRPLTNWWTFIGDFDNAMDSGLGLVE